jgi:hypothetical protein
MRNALKAALFVSAFAPALISVGAARMLAGSSFSDSIYYIVGGVIGILSVIYILSALKWHGETFPFQAKKIESNDALLFGVVFSYMLPFFVRAGDITFVIILALAVVACAVFWFTDAPLPSPLIRMLGYRFYKAESSNGMVYTLITTRQINAPSDVKKVKRISASMLLEISE